MACVVTVQVGRRSGVNGGKFYKLAAKEAEKRTQNNFYCAAVGINGSSTRVFRPRDKVLRTFFLLHDTDREPTTLLLPLMVGDVTCIPRMHDILSVAAVHVVVAPLQWSFDVVGHDRGI